MAVRLLRTILLATLAFTAGSAAAEGVYKWVDAQGQAHFGSAPPPGVKSERINTQSSAATPASAEQGRGWQEQLNLSNQRRQQKNEQDQQAAKRQQENDQRCQSARYALDSLSRGGARYRINTQGEREYLDDSQRQAARDAAAQRVATYCGN
jgi:hypothetical protein